MMMMLVNKMNNNNNNNINQKQTKPELDYVEIPCFFLLFHSSARLSLVTHRTDGHEYTHLLSANIQSIIMDRTQLLSPYPLTNLKNKQTITI